MCDSLRPPRTIALQAPPTMEFSRQEYWSGEPFPSPRDPPDPGIEPGAPALLAGSLSFQLQVQFSRSVVSNSLRPHESQHARPPRPGKP